MSIPAGPIDRRWVVPERGSRFAMQALLSLRRLVGHKRLSILLWPVSLYFLVANSAARRASRAYLRRVRAAGVDIAGRDRAGGRQALDGGAEPGLMDVLRHIHAFAHNVLDRIAFLIGDADAPALRVSGQQALLDALAGGRGCLLLGAHIGSFEAMRVLGAEHRLPMRMLMYRAHLGGASAALECLAPDYAATVIPLGQPEAMIRVAESLQRGEIVGILGDRSAGTGRSVPVELLGGRTRIPDGAFRLALVTGAPMVLASAIRSGDGAYDVRFEALGVAQPPVGAGGDQRRDFIAAAVTRYAAWMDAACREHPFSWFNFFDYWNERP